MTSTVEMERLNALIQHLDKFKKEHDMTTTDMTVDLFNILHNFLEANIQYAIAVPRYSFQALELNKFMKQACNKLVYKINNKRNVLKSLSKEYLKKQYGK